MILFGLVFGRWWRTTLAVSVVAWPVMLVMTGITGEVAALAFAAFLSVANAAIGVLAHQGLLRLARLGSRAASTLQPPFATTGRKVPCHVALRVPAERRFP